MRRFAFLLLSLFLLCVLVSDGVRAEEPEEGTSSEEMPEASSGGGGSSSSHTAHHHHHRTTDDAAPTGFQNGQPAFQGDFAAEAQVLDERTLLDVFGEAAKEFLTQRVIPETDEECQWDWRSVKCEPACECKLQAQLGDYHLGRACRKRKVVQDDCVAVDPASIWQDTPVTRRLWSLVTQTGDIVKLKVAKAWETTKRQTARRFSNLQHHQCDDLWEFYQEQRQQGAETPCLPPALVPQRSLPQRILCGPIDFNVCEEEFKLAEAAEAAARTGRFMERPTTDFAHTQSSYVMDQQSA